MSAVEKSWVVTVFCVQPFWHDGRKLCQSPIRQCRTREAALEMAEKIAKTNAGVIVYSVTGEAEFQSWGDPELIAKFGSTPAVEM